MDPDDVEMLQDLIVAAVNEAMRSADNDASSSMQKLTGGLGLPFLKMDQQTGTVSLLGSRSVLY